MPSITEASPPSSKKRRRNDSSDTVELQMKISNASLPRPSYETIPPYYDYDAEFIDGIHHRQILRPKRRSHDSKRQRIGHLSCGGGRDIYFALEPRADTSAEQHDHAITQKEATKDSGKINLSPCHICRRKPTAKSEVDGFGDCESCGERTCYICTRRCEGPGLLWRKGTEQNLDGGDDSMVIEDAYFMGTPDLVSGHKFEDESGPDQRETKGSRAAHRDLVCSACCLERGSEGEIWCWGCLKAEKAL
ncbi:hypothetical protein VTL71DRAFT_2329 [Oculimacula yallundae]|uniref:Uncharacterized protein n=1 Tax=Oculimacula yallundae TaxID=86028 RepID=A0ABR4C8L6_9HELO